MPSSLFIGVLADTSWGQQFATYDLRVNGAIITVIAADLRPPASGSHRDFENGYVPRKRAGCRCSGSRKGDASTRIRTIWEMDPKRQ